tara:strand:+ start:34253 stop:34462 length:210 start_codon:yes stop_codon:yes gene_type:complete
MNTFFKKLQDKIADIIVFALTLLCLGVIVQLLLGEKILGWDPVGNIQDAGPSFIGVIAIIALYLLFKKK